MTAGASPLFELIMSKSNNAVALRKKKKAAAAAAAGEWVGIAEVHGKGFFFF